LIGFGKLYPFIMVWNLQGKLLFRVVRLGWDIGAGTKHSFESNQKRKFCLGIELTKQALLFA
jgi:hypothetical protein